MDDIMKYALGALVTFVLGVIGWAFSITARVAVLEARINDLKEFLGLRLDKIEKAIHDGPNHV